MKKTLIAMMLVASTSTFAEETAAPAPAEPAPVVEECEGMVDCTVSTVSDGVSAVVDWVTGLF